MGAALIALIVANTPLSVFYNEALEFKVGFHVGPLTLNKPLLLWINDGLMAVFFLLVGLEVKREIVIGHLSTLKQAILPAIAAFGGMLVPAAIYFATTFNHPHALSGWAIPTATDIAFALGVLTLAGKKVPLPLKTFLLSVAIFDDLGAIVIIALFYADTLSLVYGIAAVLIVAALCTVAFFRIKSLIPYLILGLVLWVAVLKSGVHATLAGVVTAMFIPLKGRSSGADAVDMQDPPLIKLEHTLHPWVSFGVLPLFAFANSGISLFDISIQAITEVAPLGIFLGLVLGKPLGVCLLSYIAVGLKMASLPAGIRWGHIFGVSLLCGIGFTMSFFIYSLAFEVGAAPSTQAAGRLSILAASLVSGTAGFLFLRAKLKSAKS
ncbi:MAG: Na+/H+ antiporter NhaA [Candidatus Dadabacteria bacterium]|nr:MAG: Na+/H+ antiporter NhaA [Candidatus Dadabacteria bacterium]